MQAPTASEFGNFENPPLRHPVSSTLFTLYGFCRPAVALGALLIYPIQRWLDTAFPLASLKSDIRRLIDTSSKIRVRSLIGVQGIFNIATEQRKAPIDILTRRTSHLFALPPFGPEFCSGTALGLLTSESIGLPAPCQARLHGPATSYTRVRYMLNVRFPLCSEASSGRS